MHFFNKDTAKAVEAEGKRIIAGVLEQINSVCFKSLDAIVKDHTPDPETANMLNAERYETRDLKRMAMTYFEHTLKDIPHDDVDHGVNITIEAINGGLQSLYKPAVGKCMKCSMMYFAKVTLNKEVAEDIMMDEYDADSKITPKTEYQELMAEAKSIINGDTGDCPEKDVVCKASNLLDDTEYKTTPTLHSKANLNLAGVDDMLTHANKLFEEDK
jgi:hypothetical protein